MRFVWDGNTILHEYISKENSDKIEDLEEYSSQNKSEIPDNLVTWLFNDGFVPSAKITNEGNYSIISDYLGTPVEAYDEQGNRVWSAELDIYGRVKEFTGEKDFIPFRYQGQYEDTETRLYYNRFRYYSPNEGVYTQIDPIGLAGGNPTVYGYVHDPNTWIDPFGLAKKGGGFTIGANTAQQDVIARGVHFNVHGPGVPNKGGHLTLSPLKDATGKLTGNFELKSADGATSKLTSKQMKQISSQVTDYLQPDGNVKKLSETAKGALDKGGIKDPKRIQQLKDVSSVLDDHIKNGTKPKCL